MKLIAYREERYGLTEKGEVISLANNLPLSPSKNPNGYLKVSLANGDGSSEQVSVHRLMAKHFLPNPYDHKYVNHIDGDKTNNSISNLEWCSAKENNYHALKIGLRPGYMSADEKDALIEEVFAGAKIRDLATRIGRREESLSGMLRRRVTETGREDLWKHFMKGRRSEITALRNKTFSRGKRNSL